MWVAGKVKAGGVLTNRGGCFSQAHWVECSHAFEPEGTHWLMKEKMLLFSNPLAQFCSQLHLLQICFDSRQN